MICCNAYDCDWLCNIVTTLHHGHGWFMVRLISLVGPGFTTTFPLPEMWRMPRFLHHRRKPTTGARGLDKMVPVDGICSWFSAE